MAKKTFIAECNEIIDTLMAEKTESFDSHKGWPQCPLKKKCGLFPMSCNQLYVCTLAQVGYYS